MEKDQSHMINQKVSESNRSIDQIILHKIQNKSKKIFKIVQQKKSLMKYKIYNRKEKSLEELSKKFVNCLIDYDEKVICLDEITNQLNVERRRIYDIINILESLQVVKRKCKNKYTWSGFNTIYNTLQQYESSEIFIPIQNSKREKSLEVLSSGFIKLFMKNKEIWSLEEAAKFLGNEIDQNKLKTKVRRLYDIANVLKSIGLIKKIHLQSSNKPAFQWIGQEGLTQFYNNLKNPKIKQSQNIQKNNSQIEQQTKQENINQYFGQCIDFIIQQQINDRKQKTEQKNRELNQNTITTITPKLRKTYTIIYPPRITTPKKGIRLTPKKNLSNTNTPNKNVCGSLIGKFNQNI